MATTVTQGQTFTDTGGRSGVAQFNPNTGAPLSHGQSVNVNQGSYTADQVSQINAAREANVNAGVNAYTGAGATAASNAAGKANIPVPSTPLPTPPPSSSNTPVNTNQPSPTSANATPYTGGVSDAQAQANLASGGLTGDALTAAQKSLSAFQAAHAGANTSGLPAPQDAGTGMSVATGASSAAADSQGYVSPAPVVQAVTDALQKQTADFSKAMSTQGQGESLVQQYQDMTNQLGIPAMDMQLINMKNVIDGTEDDIRNEVTKAGGFATDSQVLALSNARNKVMIQNYNTLLQTRTDMQQQVTTMMGLAEQDRTYASQQIDRQLNFDQAQLTFAQSALTNAQTSLSNTAKDYGWNAIYQSAMASNDPTAVDKINATMGNGFDLAGIAGQTPLGSYQVVKGGTDAFGNTLPDSVFNSKTGQFENMPQGSSDNSSGSSSGSSSSGDPVSAAMQAIVGNESGGNYSAVSKKLPNGSQSYGKYQVLDSNIPSWTKAATGTAMTPQQFLASPSAQDAVAQQQIGNLWNKYGNIADVASVWFTGRPAAQSSGAKDPTTGTTQPQYIASATAAFNKIMGSGTGTPATTGGNASFDQYGLLSKTNFNPANMVDGLAQKYLDQYIKNGSVPTASSLGRNMKPEAMAQVDARARELYYQATGQPMPTPQLIEGYQQQLTGNNKLLNNLNVQEGTIQANATLLTNTIKNSGVNGAMPTVNNILNPILDAMGDPNVATYLAQNSTISNELGSLLALKNAQGSTVYDKMNAAGLLPKGATGQQITAVVTKLLQEAQNSHNTLLSANADLYKQTDPLMQDANNPLRQQTANSGFVEKSLTSQGLNYNTLMSEMGTQTPAGHQPALDASTGKPVFATPDEIRSGKYIPL